MTFAVVIPARYASTRLPGKPLADIAGKPMIQHVYHRAEASGARPVVIATDDERICEAVRAFGAEARMTSAHHRSGTERVAEVAEALFAQGESIVVNVQGDEPLLPPALIKQVASNLAAHPEADVATLCEPIDEASALLDPSVVKVVFDRHGYALYFSRAPIPWYRDRFVDGVGDLPENSLHFRHVGIYAYRTAFLRRYVAQPASELERVEALEQLRVLYEGGRIHVARALEPAGPGVDNAEDLIRVRRWFARDGADRPVGLNE